MKHVDKDFQNITMVSYRDLVEELPYCIMEVDFNGKVLFINRFFGDIPAVEIEGQTILQLMTAEDQKKFSQSMENIINGSELSQCEIAFFVKGGEKISCQFKMGRPIADWPSFDRILVIGMLKEEEIVDLDQSGSIQDKLQIRDLLLKAIIGSESVDVALDGSDESFTSIFLPFQPKVPGTGDITRETDFIPGGYLKEMNQILLSPLEPSFGNVKIRRAGKIQLTFYLDGDAFRTNVAFQGVVTGVDGHALRMVFPQFLLQEQRRQAKRIKIPFGMNYKIRIRPVHGDMFDTQLGDISATGLSFYYPSGTQPLAADSEISIHLPVGNGRSLELFGMVCNIHTIRDANNLETLRKKGGVEFFPITHAETHDLFKKLIDKLEQNYRFFLESKQKKYNF